VPPPAIRELRDLTRYRLQQVRDHCQEVNRLCNRGHDRPGGLGRPGARPAASEAPRPAARPAGALSVPHAYLLQQILAKIDFLDETIERVTAEIDRRLAPFEATLAALDTIPGVDRVGAITIVAETG
jgi:transposase